MEKIVIPYYWDRERGLLFSDEEGRGSPVRTKFFSDQQLREFYRQTKDFVAGGTSTDGAPVASHIEGTAAPIDNQLNKQT